MVEYDKLDISEGIDINKNTASIGIFQIKILNMSHIFAMVVMI